MNSTTLPEAPELHGLRQALSLGVAVLLGLGLAGALWSAWAPVSGAVVLHGSLRPTQQRVAVVSSLGGVISDWRLHEGQTVRRGELLAQLDDPDTTGQRDLMVDAEEAERLRLQRQRLLSRWSPGAAAPQLDAPSAQTAASLLGEEQRLLERSWQTQQATLDQIERQWHEASQRTEALRRATVADRAALQLAREELQRNEGLVQDGFISATRLLGLQRTVQEAESRLAVEQGALGEAADRLAELDGQRRNEPLRLARESARELAETERRLADLGQRRQVAQARWQRLQVRAPSDGQVVDLRPLSTGSVVATGQVLADLVPAQAELQVQARLRPEDLAEVRIGADAEVQVTAFPSRDTPPLHAKVVLVGADRSLNSETTATALSGRSPSDAGVSVWLALEPHRLPLVAGMEAEVFVATRPRSPLDYWLSPLTRLWRQALRER